MVPEILQPLAEVKVFFAQSLKKEASIPSVHLSASNLFSQILLEVDVPLSTGQVGHIGVDIKSILIKLNGYLVFHQNTFFS